MDRDRDGDWDVDGSRDMVSGTDRSPHRKIHRKKNIERGARGITF